MLVPQQNILVTSGSSHYVCFSSCSLACKVQPFLWFLVMPVSESAAVPSSMSSSPELNPLLRDLVEKKLSLKSNVTSMATELKDARNRLASQELLLAQELEARKVRFILCNW